MSGDWLKANAKWLGLGKGKARYRDYALPDIEMFVIHHSKSERAIVVSFESPFDCTEEDGASGETARAEGVSDPVLIRREQPSIPEIVRLVGISGYVKIEAVINKEGDVVDACIEHSHPRGIGLDAVAIEAIEKWKYQPARQNGKPVDVYFTAII